MKRLNKIAIVSAMIISFILPYSTPAEAAKTSTAVVNVDSNLNIRQKASASSKKVGTLKKGTKVTVYANTKSGWSEIRFKNKKAYVSTKYLKFNSTATKATTSTKQQNSSVTFAKTSYQATANLNMRSGSNGTKSPVILTIPKGKIVSSKERKGDMVKVTYTYKSKGKSITKSGWVSGKYLKEYYKYTNTAKTYYATQKTTNLRSSPDTKKKVVTKINKGNVVSSTQKVVNSLGQTWYRVSFNGKNYYVISSDMKKVTLKTIPQTNYLAKNDTYLYSSYGNAYKKLIKIPKGSVISTKLQIGNWFKVTYKGKSGYIEKGSFTKFNIPSEKKIGKETYTTASKVNLKEYAHNSSYTLASIPKGVIIIPTHKTSNGWFKIQFEGKTGYISSNYVEGIKNVEPPKEEPPKVEPPKEKITEVKIAEKTFLVKENLNVRKIADATSTILTTIPKGKIVIPTHKTSNNWYKVVYSGKTGYVSGAYLQEVKTGDPLTTRTGYQFIDLRTQSSVTAAQINNYIAKGTVGKTSVLSGKGQVFIDTGKKYGVNALFLAAHAIHESGYGTSNISLGKYNLFGFGAFDAAPYVGAYRFSSVNSNIDYIARELKSTYLNPSNWKYNGAYLGFSTKTLSNIRIDANSEGMNFYYASDQNWGKKIASHMEKILPYKKADYDKAPINTSVPTQPSVPAGSDLFPNDITVIAKKDLQFHSKKGILDAKPKKVKKGSVFTLLEKTNDYWVKVKIDNKEYWTNEILFHSYKNYISVQNLGRVNVDNLNVRPEANTSKTPIGTLSLNQYVQIVLKKDGTITMDSSKKWYQVKLSNGKTGWVSSQYITRELN
ncbi:SH3 domain-containing protein [Bacillus sp. FJAT-49732]|uniref:SH3 domain-containing protein n=1 Tax=Lederbergia citrisecunda TaxID=2833583 RepID=A0A942YLG4_9BACI|nr:SH3 domain-containing protein [Lederbergia citrisecunda]MBS4200627.1 SH3 domain-containing protein [Lederbergia citrisecunda]